VLDVLLALPIAMWVAYRRGSLTDRTIMVVTTVALSISFLVYMIVGQYLFGFQLGWFPVQGWSDSVWTNLLTYAPLPVLLAVMVGVAPQTRLYRSFFLDELGHDYVRTARAKGLTEGTVLFKHVLRNAMIPILTNVGPAAAGHLRRQLPDRGVLLDPRPGPRGAAGGEPQRLPGDPGRHRVPGDADDADQPAPTCSTRWSIRGWCSNERRTCPPRGAHPVARAATAVQHRALQREGVWHAAWRRFKADRVGMVSLVVVLAFLLLIALAAAGLVASQWQQEVGVPNAPPTFMGPPPEATGAPSRCPRAPTSTCPTSTRWRRATRSGTSAPPSSRPRDHQGRDPALGGDRLGRDVLAKAIKGTEISVFVGVMAALVATLIGTLLGAWRASSAARWATCWSGSTTCSPPSRHPADLRLRGGASAAASTRWC
jgi:ABC-type dipeptide/oligopeptide/nickel transport system permease subunit